MNLLEKKPLFIVLAIAAIAIIGFLVFPYIRPAPEIALPSNFDKVDPSVQAFIKSKLAAVEASPRSAEMHGDLGLVYEANLLWDEAKSCFETAARLAPDELSWNYHLAIAYRQSGDDKKALELLRAMAESHQSVPYLQQRLGEALLESGELDNAEAIFRTLIKLAPEVAQGYAGLGDVMLQKEQYQQAVLLLEKAVSLSPDYRKAHYLLGTAYHRLGQIERAKAELAKGVAAKIRFLPDPQSSKLRTYAVNVTARLSRAEAMLAVGQPRQAAQILELALPYHQDNVTLLNTLAVAYMRMGLLDAAEKKLRQAEKYKDSRFMTYINLSSLKLRQNQLENALRYADSAVVLAPKLDQPYFTRAQVLDGLGRFEDALLSLQKAQERDPQNPQNFSFAGDIYLKRDNAQKAYTVYKGALALDANMLPALAGIARANWKLNRRDAAREALLKAQKIAPNHPVIRKLEQQFNSAK